MQTQFVTFLYSSEKQYLKGKPFRVLKGGRTIFSDSPIGVPLVQKLLTCKKKEYTIVKRYGVNDFLIEK